MAVACVCALALTAWADEPDHLDPAVRSGTVEVGGAQLDFSKEGGTLGSLCDYDWYRGCSPTSAGMLTGWYDRNGYAGQAYRNLMPTGVCEDGTFVGPPTGSSAECNANMIASNRHISDFFVGPTGASGDDASGAPSGPFDCLADFMGTSQDAAGNSNGSTTWWYWTDGSAYTVADAFGNGHPGDSGLYGIYDYLLYRGYQDPDPTTEAGMYNQYIDALGKANGFTLAQYQAEIDAGRPVLIHTENHTLCGVGYGTGNTIEVLDTWSAGPHPMTWGGSYGGAAHRAVTVVALDGVGAEDNAVGGLADCSYTVDGFASGAAGGSTAGLPADEIHLDATMVASNFDGGSDGWATLKFFYCDEDLADVGIVDESELRLYWWGGSAWQSETDGEFTLGGPIGGLGDFGVDADNNYAWLNVDHGSEWALAVPEPVTVGMFLIAAAPALLARRRTRRTRA